MDTSAFYALVDETDLHHRASHQFREAVRETTHTKLVTSNFVLCETLNLIKRRFGSEAAVSFAETILESRVMPLLRIEEAHEKSAWEIFKRYTDKGFSFTDCTSFALMEKEGIHQAFAFDRHFFQFGLKMVP